MLTLMSVTVAVEVALAGFGLVLTPSAATGVGWMALAAVTVAQLSCVGMARWGPVSLRRAPARTIAVGTRVGAVTGGAYAVLIIAEYVYSAVTSASPASFDAEGIAIVAALVVAAGVAGTWGARVSASLRGGVTAAVWAAVVEYLVWYPAVLGTYYAFYGTSAEERFLRAEGMYDDMRRSGMTDIRAFAIQDLYGAGFFHLVAGLVLALLFGTGCAALTIGIRRARVRTVTGGTV